MQDLINQFDSLYLLGKAALTHLLAKPKQLAREGIYHFKTGTAGFTAYRFKGTFISTKPFRRIGKYENVKA